MTLLLALVSAPAQAQGLSFTKEFVDDPVAPGELVTLRFEIANNTPEAMSSGFFTDDLSAVLPGLTAVSGSSVDPCGPGSTLVPFTGQLLILTGASLAQGDFCTFDVTLIVPAGAAPGAYVNTTSTFTYGVDGRTAPPATDTLDVVIATWSKAFTDDPVEPGELVGLEITLTNPSSVSSLSQLSFTDDLDAVIPGLVAVDTPQSDVCGAGSVLTGSSLLSFSGGSLPPGGSCTIQTSVLVPAGASEGSFVNTTSDLFASGVPIADPASDTLQVTAPAVVDPLDDVVTWANDAYGSAVVDEGSGKNRLRPSTWDAQLDDVLAALHQGGCTVEPVAQNWMGGAFNLRQDTAHGTWTGGAVDGTVDGGFQGSLENGGSIGGAYAALANPKLVADVDGSGFVAGHWVRITGRRGVFFGVTGACDDSGTAADALDAWFPGGTAGWP